MSALIKQASEHWRYVAPLLTKPTSEDDYDAMVAMKPTHWPALLRTWATCLKPTTRRSGPCPKGVESRCCVT